MSATILIQAKKETAIELRDLIKKKFRKTPDDFLLIKKFLDNGMTLIENPELKNEFILSEPSRLGMEEWQLLGEMTENYEAVMPFTEIWMIHNEGKDIAKGDYGFVNGEQVNKLKYSR